MKPLRQPFQVTAVATLSVLLLAGCSAPSSPEEAEQEATSVSTINYIGENENTEQNLSWGETVGTFLADNDVKPPQVNENEPRAEDYSTYLGEKDECRVQFITSDFIPTQNGIPNTFQIYQEVVQQNLTELEVLEPVVVKTSNGGGVSLWGLKTSIPNFALEESVDPNSENYNPDEDLIESGTINTLQYFLADNSLKNERNSPDGFGYPEEAGELVSAVIAQVSCLDSDPSDVIPNLGEKLASSPDVIIDLEEIN